MPESGPQRKNNFIDRILYFSPWRIAERRNKGALENLAAALSLDGQSIPHELPDSLVSRWDEAYIILAGNGGVGPEDVRKIW